MGPAWEGLVADADTKTRETLAARTATTTPVLLLLMKAPFGVGEAASPQRREFKGACNCCLVRAQRSTALGLTTSSSMESAQERDLPDAPEHRRYDPSRSGSCGEQPPGAR